MKIRMKFLMLLLVSISLLCMSSCKSPPYYGGYNAPQSAVGYVPYEVERTQAWIALPPDKK